MSHVTQKRNPTDRAVATSTSGCWHGQACVACRSVEVYRGAGFRGSVGADVRGSPRAAVGTRGALVGFAPA